MSAWHVALRAALCLVGLVSIAGCDGHLVGTRDVELDYRAASPAVSAPFPAGHPWFPGDLRERVLERIHAADLAADVSASEERLFVSADESSVEEVDELITWPGGMRIYRLDPDASMEPKRLDELTPRTETSNRGETVRYFVGPPAAVARAAHVTPSEGGHRLIVEPLPGAIARTRVARDPPFFDLREAIVAAEADGAKLQLKLTEEAKATLASTDLPPDEPVAFVRDNSILAVAPLPEALAEGSLTLRLGSSPRAYARAEVAARLLGTKTLPRLVRTAVTRKPPSYRMACAEVAIPIFLSLAWLAFIRRFDRARPEPLWLVLVTFALGCAAVLPVSLVEWRLEEFSVYTNPQLMTFGGQIWAFPIALAAYATTIGLVEEGGTLLAAWAVARQRREFDEPVDGIIYASAAALGFAALENIRYFAAGRVAGGLVVTRAFMSAPAHFLFASIWGYALGQRLIDPKKRVWPYFLASALAHGAFDTCLSFPATAHFAPLLNFALASVFVLMLRKALRYGPVRARGSALVSRGRLDVFPVGSRLLFALFVLALHASAALVFFLGVYAEQTHDRIGPPFILASTVLVALVGITAYGVSASLPLDVVLDDAGATFAGAFLSWDSVARVERRRGRGGRPRQRILLLGAGARLALGPVDEASVDRLLAAVYARMSQAATRPVRRSDGDGDAATAKGASPVT
jgi:RsiW-degrading membrane proteinase PrsW (M82 family)